MDFRDLTFGVEIEVTGQTRRRVAEAVASVVGGTPEYVGGAYDKFRVKATDGRTWQVMRDSSVSGDYHHQGEVVTPVLRYEDLETLQNVVRAVRACGAKVDESCGIHIHVGAQSLTASQIANVAKMVYQQEALISPALQIASGREYRYAKRVSAAFLERLRNTPPQTMDDLNRAWFGHFNPTPQHYDESRYHGLNLHSVWYRGTIEFRWFNSTLHAGKVKAYVQLCLKLVAKAASSSRVKAERRETTEATARYDFRVFLLRLGMIGDEFKTARLHLLAHLSGDCAFRSGRP
jgi:hypothetical protein